MDSRFRGNDDIKVCVSRTFVMLNKRAAIAFSAHSVDAAESFRL
jgi:hypothetical protein